jgi:hypothetical protein
VLSGQRSAIGHTPRNDASQYRQGA